MKNIIRTLLAACAVLAMANSAHAFYDAVLGRFATRDPIEERGGINLYRYVGNNPINATDPLGLDPAFTPEIGIFQGLTADEEVEASRMAIPTSVYVYADAPQKGNGQIMLSGNWNGGLNFDNSLLATYKDVGTQWTGSAMTWDQPNHGSISPAIQVGNQYGGVFTTNQELSVYGGLPVPGTPFSIGVGVSWDNPLTEVIANLLKQTKKQNGSGCK